MVWLRESVFHLLSLLLLVSLLGLASSTATRLTFAKPDNVKHWLDQSNFYDHFVNNAINQAQESSDSNGASQISFHDPAVQQAAKSALTRQVFQQNVNNIVDSNYAWLEGKTTTPAFNVDLKSSKQSFADQIGKYVQTHLSSLPACTPAQLLQFQNLQSINPLTVICRPPGLDPKTEASVVSRQVAANSDFLSNTHITAQSLNPSQKDQGQPYYQKVSYAPKLYRLGLILPFIFAGFILISILGVFNLAPRRRVGLRKIGFTLLVAGVLLILTKIIADFGLNRVESKLTNALSVGELQHALTSFLQLAEHQLVKFDLYFGGAYILLAVVALAGLLITRHRSPKQPSALTDPTPTEPQPGTTAPPHLKQPPRPKTPRLIQ